MSNSLKKIEARVRLANIINYAIEATLWSIIVLVPLYFSFFWKSVEFFSLNASVERALIFKALVLACFCLTGLKILIDRSISFGANFRQLIYILGWFAALSLSVIFSVDPHMSWFGSYARQMGLDTNLYYLLFFILLLTNLRSRQQVERLVTALVVTGGIVSALGVLEWFGVNLFFRSAPFAFQGRVGSTFAQPVFLGNFLLLVVFLSAYKWQRARIFPVRTGYFISTVSIISALLLTYSRGAWIGLAGSLGVAGIIILYRRNMKYFIIAFLTLGIIFSSLGALAYLKPQLFRPPSEVKEVKLHYRIRSILYFGSGSTNLRLKYWLSARKPFMERPLIGYGLENLRQPLIEAYEPSWAISENINSYADRYHNEYIDILIATGLLGLTAFLLFAGQLAWRAMRFVVNESEDRAFVGCVGLSLAAYLISLFFSFTIIETGIYFWLLVSLLIFSLNKFNPVFHSFDKLKRMHFYILAYTAGVLCLIAVLAVQNDIYKLKGEYYYQLAKKAFRDGNAVLMLDNYTRAINHNGDEEYYRNSFITDLINTRTVSLVSEKNGTTTLVDFVSDMISAEQAQPENYFSLMRRGLYYSVFGFYQDKKYYLEAESAYEKLHAINSNLPDPYRDQARLYEMWGRYDDSISAYENLIAVLPDINNPEMNPMHRGIILEYLSKVYEGMGNVFLKQGKYADCINANRVILRINPYNYSAYKAAAEAEARRKDYQSAIWYLKRGAMLSPDDFQWYYKMALVYKVWGRLDEARASLEKALKLKPSDTELLKLGSELATIKEMKTT